MEDLVTDAQNGKKSGKRAKRDMRDKLDKRNKRPQLTPMPVRVLPRSAPAALAVAAGALIVAGISGLWRVRR